MARAVSSAEVTPREIVGAAGNRVTVTDFFGNLQDAQAAPQAFLVRYDRDGTIRPHFHKVDQYQVVVEGGGTLGKHPLTPVVVHYTDGFMPYGPIHAGAEGLAFFTLRVRPDVGAFFMPGSSDRMERKAGRPAMRGRSKRTATAATRRTRCARRTRAGWARSACGWRRARTRRGLACERAGASTTSSRAAR